MAFGRTFLYHSTAPKGIIFDKEDEYLVALGEGWVEAPWLVGEPKAPSVVDNSIPIEVSPKIKKPPSAKPIKAKKSPGRKAAGRKAGGNR